MFNCLLGARCFAHARRVQDDQALAVILGMKKSRLCGEDALYRMMEKVPREQARTWLAWSERDLYAAQGRSVCRRFGFDREHPLRKARGRRPRLKPAQTGTMQSSSLAVCGRGHTPCPLHGVAARKRGQRRPLDRGDGTSLVASRCAWAPATQPGRHWLCAGKNNGLARDAWGRPPALSVQT